MSDPSILVDRRDGYRVITFNRLDRLNAFNDAMHCGVADHADAADRPRKLSHINVNAGESEATFACCRDALGFTLTDTTARLRFLSCNADHHSMVLGFTGGPSSIISRSRCPISNR